MSLCFQQTLKVMLASTFLLQLTRCGVTGNLPPPNPPIVTASELDVGTVQELYLPEVFMNEALSVKMKFSDDPAVERPVRITNYSLACQDPSGEAIPDSNQGEEVFVQGEQGVFSLRDSDIRPFIDSNGFFQFYLSLNKLADSIATAQQNIHNLHYEYACTASITFQFANGVNSLSEKLSKIQFVAKTIPYHYEICFDSRGEYYVGCKVNFETGQDYDCFQKQISQNNSPRLKNSPSWMEQLIPQAKIAGRFISDLLCSSAHAISHQQSLACYQETYWGSYIRVQAINGAAP